MMRPEIGASLLGICAWAFFGGCGDSHAKAASQKIDFPPASAKIDFPLSSDVAKRRQAEAARELGVPVEKEFDLGKGGGIKMVLIPAGEFMMGSPPGEANRDPHEELHRVAIGKPFWMGKIEVTQEQWEAVMGNNPSHRKGATNPVESVSWNDVQGFLQKLNGGQAGPFALPTEAQWEYACRAGTSTRFCSGDADEGLGEYAWYGANSAARTHPVGQKGANAWGLHDIAGNVAEWCASPYVARYDGSELKGAEAGGALRVVRGGSWVSLYPGNCRSAARSGLGPRIGFDFVGFRVVRSAKASE